MIGSIINRREETKTCDGNGVGSNIKLFLVFIDLIMFLYND
jgi:hypothetical protein